MKYARLGRSNLKVSRVCLGTMHFGGRATEDESFRIMDRALELGVNFFDTANVYGVYGDVGYRGLSEEIIGHWLKARPGARDKIVLASKVYGAMDDPPLPNQEGGISAFKVRRHLADSLKRLQTDHLDLYQVHHLDRTISLEEFWTTFGNLVDRGEVLYIGTSNFTGWGLAKFQSAAWHRGQVGIVSEQSMYSLLCRYPELEVLPAALDLGIGVIPYMPLAGGLLSGKRNPDPTSRTQDVSQEYGVSLGQQNEQLAAFSRLCRELGESETVVAIAWTLANPTITSPIVGVRTVAQLDGLDRAAELVLPVDFLAKLNAVFEINKGRPLRSGPAPEAYAW